MSCRLDRADLARVDTALAACADRAVVLPLLAAEHVDGFALA
jgi:hypothetical protein